MLIARFKFAYHTNKAPFSICVDTSGYFCGASEAIRHIGITLFINIIHQSVRLSDSMCFSWHHMYSLNNNTQVYEENNQILFSFDMEKCAPIVLILVCFFKNLQYWTQTEW